MGLHIENMEIETREIKVQDNVFDAVRWLETEYPHGVDLVYIDYRDSYDENTEKLQAVLKGEDELDETWIWDAQAEAQSQVIQEYLKQTETEEITDEVRQAITDWLQEHDTSNVTEDLLKNTSKQLFYINTLDYSNEDKSNASKLIKKYGRTEAQRKDIKYVLNEQFYESPVSFYFYLNVLDVFKALHTKESKYIVIKGAYFSTIDRVQGSNWLGDKAVFTITIPRQDFIDNVFLDKAKGTGYGWGEIAGQTSYEEAEIEISNTKKNGTILLKSETTESQKREAELAKNWSKSKKCTLGDMNYGRHSNTEYINDFPCGNKCNDCGTFWID